MEVEFLTVLMMMVLGLGVSPEPELPEIPSFAYLAYSRPFCEVGTDAENNVGSGGAGVEASNGS